MQRVRSGGQESDEHSDQVASPEESCVDAMSAQKTAVEALLVKQKLQMKISACKQSLQQPMGPPECEATPLPRKRTNKCARKTEQAYAKQAE